MVPPAETTLIDSCPALAADRLRAEERKLRDLFDPGQALLWSSGPGHTAEVRPLERAHDGRASAQWLALRYLLVGEQPEDLEVLGALRSLQVLEPTDRFYGCSRWFGEETRIEDTNAAFFIIRPLIIRYWLAGGIMSQPQRQALEEYFRDASVWFCRECAEPALFYPNKTISDGAVTLALAQILGADDIRRTALAFLDRWCEYVEQKGWGYGENMSLSYCGVILQALWMILRVLPIGPLRGEVERIEAALVDNLRFHTPFQLVPTIRSYNFDGKVDAHGELYDVLGWGQTEPNRSSSEQIQVAADWMSALLLQLSGIRHVQPISSSVECRTEPVSFGAVAVTYRGERGRLGTLSRFPVIPGCYQHPCWGLGWQSMPVAFFIEGGNYGFLQWQVSLRDGEIRTHPASSFLGGIAKPALFHETIYPAVNTYSRQDGPLALSFRVVTSLAAELAGLWDQWRIPQFRGECWVDGQPVLRGKTVHAKGWISLVYPDTVLAVRSLSILAAAADSSTPSSVEITWDGDALLLRQCLFGGPLQRLERSRLEAGWITWLMEACSGLSEAASKTELLYVEDCWWDDHELPRTAWTHIHTVSVSSPDHAVTLQSDPLQSGEL